MESLLDLADGSLNAQSPEQALMAQLKMHLCEHIIYPPFIDRGSCLPELKWEKIPFSPESRELVPKKKGVYAFVLEVQRRSILPFAHVLYVGKAGDLTSDNTLWKRYYDYVRTEKVKDRPRIAQMLLQWKGCLSYYYAVIEEDISTGQVEESLLDILIPPYNRSDFSAELSNLLRGANII